MSTRNARFWVVLLDDPVKITLRPGQRLHWSTWSPDEEGWSSRLEEFEHAGDRVYWRSRTDGVDCDGRLTQYWEGSATLENLAIVDLEQGLLQPSWENEKSSQRDYFAEAMGY